MGNNRKRARSTCLPGPSGGILGQVTAIPVPLRRPVRPRDPHERGRAATPLELLFDLVFVVAVASNATELHHGLADGHLATVAGYAAAWFAIWWAWMNYTWFASAYDNDDVAFRILTFVIMTGALLLAAGVPALFEHGNGPVAVLGYAVMRFGMVGMWLRAASGHPERRTTALWYAGGIATVQLLWIARLWVPDGWIAPTFVLLAAAELSVPWLAEARHGQTPFHPHHIVERYGLMTIIVLGEVILSSVVAVQQAIAAPRQTGEGSGGSAGHAAPVADAAGDPLLASVAPLVLGGLLIVFSLWWLYFSREQVPLVESPGGQWLFGYGHYLVFAGVAAVGSALAAAVDVATGYGEVGGRVIGLALAVAVAVAVGTMAVLHRACPGVPRSAVVPLVVAVVVGLVVAVALPVVQWTVLGVGLALAGAVVASARASSSEEAAAA